MSSEKQGTKEHRNVVTASKAKLHWESSVAGPELKVTELYESGIRPLLVLSSDNTNAA